jgi:hypothetical protein
MPQQVCDVSKSGVSTSLTANRILGFVPSFFFLHFVERLGQGYEQACPNFEHVGA